MSERDTADTEGAAGLQEAYGTAQDAQQGGDPDLGGSEPSTGTGGTRGEEGLGGMGGTGSGGTGGSATGGSGTGGGVSGTSDTSGAGRPTAETGEASADPNPDRRAEDPGTVATEFGDRADTAPDDEIAHPSI